MKTGGVQWDTIWEQRRLGFLARADTSTIFHPAKLKSNIYLMLGFDSANERGDPLLTAVRDSVKDLSSCERASQRRGYGPCFMPDGALDVEGVMEYRLDGGWREKLKDVQPLGWMGHWQGGNWMPACVRWRSHQRMACVCVVVVLGICLCGSAHMCVLVWICKIQIYTS